MQLRVGTTKYKLSRFVWLPHDPYGSLDMFKAARHLLSRQLDALESRTVYRFDCRDGSKTPIDLEPGNTSRVKAEAFFAVTRAGLMKPSFDPNATARHIQDTLTAAGINQADYDKAISDQMGDHSVPVPVTTAADKIGPNKSFEIVQTVKYAYQNMEPQNRPNTGWIILRLPIEITFEAIETDDCSKPPGTAKRQMPVDIYAAYITPGKAKPAKVARQHAENDLAEVNKRRDEARDKWRERFKDLDTTGGDAAVREYLLAMMKFEADQIRKRKKRITDWLKSLKKRLKDLKAAQDG